jgi:hypothetical protein
MSIPRNVNWVSDREWKNKWAGESGLIIGSGKTADYRDQAANKELVESFPGKIIGCNESFLFINPERIDLLVWIDSVVWNHPNCTNEIIKCKCPMMAIDPFDWKGDFLGLQILGLRATVPPVKFETSFNHGFHPCDDTGYLAVQVGFILGLKTIYLWGFDAWTGSYNRKAWHFGVASKWAQENGRELFVAEKTSFLCHEDQYHGRLVEFKPLPVPYRNEEGKDNNIVMEE